ncbi:uncharacterized protein LOC126734284 [Anthonomus grandis grandis]|uniref:uncharacterized protein LOC126734284 n=1 Tax=Anthonomus grandis grandis TaxID=2921223 RepID=UPI00216551B8|nr:uncharacterized protein LOC126734284 [Anthonomus grandis grandis]
MADSKTFYVSNMEVYTGKQPEGPYKINNSSDEVVKRLITPISGTGRNVTIENWFMSYPLALDLISQHNLTVVGTVRKNKRELPPNISNVKNRKENSSIFGFQGRITVVSYTPKKGKNVIMFSTMHHDAKINIETGEKAKPEIITFYNSTKSGVDTVDQLCATYNTSRNSRRWPLTIFFRLLDVAGINARIIYYFNAKENIKRRVFLKKLGLALISDAV